MRTGTTSGLAASLQGWDDERLAALLTARPDLAHPTPNGLAALAARACSGASLAALGPSLTLADLQSARGVLDGDEPSPRLVALAVAWPQDGWALAEPLARLVARTDLGEPAPRPPDVTAVTTSDDAAGAAAAQAISLTDEALWRIGQAPPRVLRAGGLPAADLRTLTRALGTDDATTALLLEAAHAAGLLRETDDDDPAWAPTPDYDEWRLLPAAERWQALAVAWLDMRQAPHLVGRPGEKGTVNALAAEAVWSPMRMLRRHVLDELATLDGGCSPADLTARVAWRHALVRVADHHDVVAAVLREATCLGVVAGGLTTPGRALLTDPHDAAATMAPLLPAPADRVLLGGDLTAVVPGLVDGPLAEMLRAATDLESRGGANVYRFTPASVERALDAGWSAASLRARLEEVAGPLPQPLGYLLDDAARRHVALVVGGCSSYLRCEDPALLADLAAAPRLALRVVAPGVAVSGLAPTVLVARLRATGRAPAVEGPDGEVHVIGQAPRRSPVQRKRFEASPPAHVGVADVQAIRAGGGTGFADVREPELVRAALEDAAAAGRTVRVDYVDQRLQPVVVDLAPSAVEAGRVHGSVGGAERVIALPRISRVRS